MKSFLVLTEDGEELTILDVFDRVGDNNDIYRMYLVAYKDGDMDFIIENDLLKCKFVRVV